MKKFFTLIFILAYSYSYNQSVTISTGTGYNKQSFYDLKTGTETQLNNNAWDIAFSNSGSTDVGIVINESAGSGALPVKLFLAPTNVWSDVITDVSVFVDSVQLLNPDKSWTSGAFNVVKTPGNPFDFGWGSYNPQTHVITGSRVFVVQKRDQTFLKLQIQSLSGANYTIRYANLDGTEEVTKSFARNGAGAGKIIFFSLDNGEILDTPADYDLIFMRYYSPVDAGGGIFLEYPVTGILLAPGTEAVKVTSVDPLDVEETPYKFNYSDSIQVIGHDWKFFDFNQGWVLDDSTAYFVKTKNNDKYKLIFLEFGGSGNGNTTFLQEFIGNTSSAENPDSESSFELFPNPASDFLTATFDGNQEAEVRVYGVNGRLLLQTITYSGSAIDMRTISYKGTAIVTLKSEGKLFAKPVVLK